MKRFLSTVSQLSVFGIALVGVSLNVEEVFAQSTHAPSLSIATAPTLMVASVVPSQQVIPAPATGGNGEPHPENVRPSSLH